MITYNDEEHSYKNVVGEQYISVTTKIGKYKPKENWAKIAEGYVAKRSDAQIITDLAGKWSLTEEEIVAKFGNTFTPEHIQYIWQQAGLRATTGGTNWHDWKELHDSRQPNTIITPMINGIKQSFDLKDIKPNHTYLEMILYSHKGKIAGQADKIIIHNNTSTVRDYKTVNKELTPEVIAYFDRDLNRNVKKKFKSPISNVLYNSYWEYALQLSIYGYLLELVGYPPERLAIDQIITEWIKEEDLTNEFVIDVDKTIGKVRIVIETKEVELPYLRKEAKALINTI